MTFGLGFDISVDQMETSMQAVYEIAYRDYKSIYYDYITDEELFVWLDSLYDGDAEVPQHLADRYEADDLYEVVEKASVPRPKYPFILLGQTERYVY